MWLIAGLGNPGPVHARQRHNAGFMLADELARSYRAPEWKSGHKSDVTRIELAGTQCILAKPQTFMNLSGGAVQALMAYYKIPPEQVLVAHDELDLPLGKLRLKQGGGHGGHNGLRSIDAAVGQNYWRLRIGIGHPRDHEDERREVHAYVLSPFTSAEQVRIETVCNTIATALPLFFTHSPEAMMSKLALALAEPTANS